MSNLDSTIITSVSVQSPQEAPEILVSRKEGIRHFLPNRNTQSGSPMNTFTISELDELRKSLPALPLGKVNVIPPRSIYNKPQNINILENNWAKNPQSETETNAEKSVKATKTPDWYGLPRGCNVIPIKTEEFRTSVRNGSFSGTTNGICPGFMQCNLVVLKQGQEAFDFLLFCQRNKKACPLIEVCDLGSPFPTVTAKNADLRSDIPR
mmetsp:Transcript_15452/g.14880  ORF Transcript_15452/g.14880 Transcript_15452/m.14880 type:complete len:209 (-) Transcript_15452:96-722(-)